jgi:hypothetical protein
VAGAVQKSGDRATRTIVGIGPAQTLAFEVGLRRCSWYWRSSITPMLIIGSRIGLIRRVVRRRAEWAARWAA